MPKLTDQEKQVFKEALDRPLAVPVEFIVEMAAENAKPIIVKGRPRIRMEMKVITCETVGDISELVKMIGHGKAHPVPDLSIQCLNIMLDLIGKMARAAEVDSESTTGTP